MVKLAFGSFGDSFSAASIRTYVAEFIATLLFVFAGVGSAIAYGKLTQGAALDPAGLVAVAVAHGLSLFVGVSVAANISGGHLNPAVTFGLAVGGHITILTGIFYWVAQLLGATVACFLLEFVTGGAAVPTHAVAAGMSKIEGVVMEAVITFALVYTVYATAADPKKGDLGKIEAVPTHAVAAAMSELEGVVMEAVITFALVYTVYATAADPKKWGLGTIVPIAIGFTVAPNILAAGPFSGGSMNPARLFGPALVAGNLAGNWVYWVGPLVGGVG